MPGTFNNEEKTGLILTALRSHAELLRGHAAECEHWAKQPQQPAKPTTPGTISLPPTPRGYAGMAQLFREQADSAEALAEQITENGL